MKGPYQRLKHDLRRLWECPECGKHTRAPGDVTFQVCSCQRSVPRTKQRCMRLVDEGVLRELELPPRPTYRPPPPEEAPEKRPKRRRTEPRPPARDARSNDRSERPQPSPPQLPAVVDEAPSTSDAVGNDDATDHVSRPPAAPSQTSQTSQATNSAAPAETPNEGSGGKRRRRRGKRRGKKDN